MGRLSGLTVCNSVRDRETRGIPVKLRSFPTKFLKQANAQVSIIAQCAEFEKLLKLHSPLWRNRDLTQFVSVVNEMIATLGIHTGTMDESVRSTFVALGGPTLVQTLIHASVFVPDSVNNSITSARASRDSVMEKGLTHQPQPTHVSSPEMVVVAASCFASQTKETLSAERNKLTSRGKARATKESFELINQVFAILTETCLDHSETAATLSSQPGLISRLLVFMTTPELLDGAVSLGQELLSAGDLFTLDGALGLSDTVDHLPPRALALFARTMAALFSKPEPKFDSTSQPGLAPSVPPPECIPPHLCASCANKVNLVNIPQLLPKLVQLLRSPTPPRRLWPARHLYVESGYAIPADDRDDTWDSFLKRTPPIHHDLYEGGLKEDACSSAPSSPTSAPVSEGPSRRRTVLGQLTGMLGGMPAYEERLVVLPQDQLPPNVSGRPMPYATGDMDLRIVNLSKFEAELWTTLRADVLFVVGVLLSNKAREKTQALFIASGFVEMLSEMFANLRWDPPPHTTADRLKGVLREELDEPEAFIREAGVNMRRLREVGALESFFMSRFPRNRLSPDLATRVRGALDEMYGDDREYGEHAPNCTCYPQSCLQMSLLRTIASFSEKTAGGSTQHHLLLLSPQDRKEVSLFTEKYHKRGDTRNTDIFLTQKNRSRSMIHGPESSPLISAEEKEREEIASSLLINDSPQSDKVEEDVEDEIMRVHSLCLSCLSLHCSKQCQEKKTLDTKRRNEEEKYYSLFTEQSLGYIGSNQPVGLIQSLVDTLMHQPPSSPLHYEIASTVHKWLQGARPVEQDMLLRRRGFLHWVLQQLLESKPTPPKGATTSISSESANPNPIDGESVAKNNLCAFPLSDVQQVLLDLLGELFKFNEVSLMVLDDAFGLPGSHPWPLKHPAFSRLVKLAEIILTNIVNAAVFVSCMELTLGALLTPLRPLQRVGAAPTLLGGGGGLSNKYGDSAVVNWVDREEATRLVAACSPIDEKLPPSRDPEGGYASMRISWLKRELKDREIDTPKGVVEKQDLVGLLEAYDANSAAQESEKTNPSTPNRDQLATQTLANVHQQPLTEKEEKKDDRVTLPRDLIDDAALSGVSEGTVTAFWRVLRPAVAVSLFRALCDAKHCTDICVINATFMLICEARVSPGALEVMVDALKERASIEKAQQVKEVFSAGEDSPQTSSPSLSSSTGHHQVTKSQFHDSLEKAILHWQRHYEHQNYERRFVEYQSGVPFSNWRKMVRWIRDDFLPLL